MALLRGEGEHVATRYWECAVARAVVVLVVLHAYLVVAKTTTAQPPAIIMTAPVMCYSSRVLVCDQ